MKPVVAFVITVILFVGLLGYLAPAYVLLDWGWLATSASWTPESRLGIFVFECVVAVFSAVLGMLVASEIEDFS